MAREIAGLGEDAQASIVFGCESRGLTEEELCLCERRVRIPAHPRQPSLNLAQAVMVAGYEVFVESQAAERGEGLPRATHEERERALESFQAALLDLGFLPPDRPEARFVEWREIFGRAGLTPRETRILLALGRRIRNVAAIARKARERSPDGT
jgi:TrmH family RNA methyltransferase